MGRANARPMTGFPKQSMGRKDKMDCFVATLLAMTDKLARRAIRLAGNLLTNRDAAADGAVQHLRGLLDPVGGGVQRIGDRGLRCLGAIRRARAHVTQRGELLLEAADAIDSVEQFVAHRQRRHHREARIADFAELAAQILNARFETLGELQKPHLLALLAGHPVLPSVDGDVDVIHEVSPASSTERMLPIAASSLSAISRLALSSRRDFTSDPSSSSASRDRSAPSA